MGAHLAKLDMVSSTEMGRDWLLKALHPTDPTVSGVSIPDGTALDTVQMEVTTSITLGAGPQVVMTGPWGCQLSLIPTISPLGVYYTDNVTPSASTAFNVRYPAFTSVAYDSDFTNLMGKCEALRLCAQSVTIHLDANATSDQGSVVACQQVTKPRLLFPEYGLTGGSIIPVAAWDYTIPFVARDVPSYNTVMSMPRAYQANLREGIYMPLRLSSTCQHWFSLRESVGDVNFNDCPSIKTGSALLPATNGNAWPHWSGTRSYVGATPPTCTPLCPMLSENVGHIVVKNVDPTSSLVVKLRSCFEFKVQGNSELVPYLQAAADVDSLAVSSYFRILRQLDDAFPASYNLNGTILNLISRAVKTLAPALGAVPVAGPMLAAMAPSVSTLAAMGSKWVRENGGARNPRRKKPKTPGAAATATATTTTAKMPTLKVADPNSKRSKRKAMALSKRGANGF